MPENAGKERICLALGFFDSVHLGHRAMIAAAREKGAQLFAKSAVFTFSSAVTVKSDCREVYTYPERLNIFKALGAETVVSRAFDDTLRLTPWRDFLESLVKGYDIAAFLCGEDHRFGRGGEGGRTELAAFCRERGMELSVLPSVNVDGERVSTTRIKQLLSSGETAAAARLLGAPYSITAAVVRGRGKGHLFGIPTANQDVPREKFLPGEGVYATRVTLDGKEYPAVTNVGARPTFSDGTAAVETLIGGYSGDLYGREITVSFLAKLRPIIKFASPEALAGQVKSDLIRSEKC